MPSTWLLGTYLACSWIHRVDLLICFRGKSRDAFDRGSWHRATLSSGWPGTWECCNGDLSDWNMRQWINSSLVGLVQSSVCHLAFPGSHRILFYRVRRLRCCVSLPSFWKSNRSLDNSRQSQAKRKQFLKGSLLILVHMNAIADLRNQYTQHYDHVWTASEEKLASSTIF